MNIDLAIVFAGLIFQNNWGGGGVGWGEKKKKKKEKHLVK